MIFPNIKAKTLSGLITVLNKALGHFSNNIDESNLKLSCIEIKSQIATPTPKLGEIIIYMDSSGDLKLLKPDGTIKTFTLT